MTVGMTGPTSFDQIRWSARTYRQNHPNFVRAYAEVNTPDFRGRTLDECDDRTAESLRRFLARFGTHADAAVRASVQAVLQDQAFAARDLRDEHLSGVDIAVSRPTIERAFDQLMGAHGVAHTIASKVLAVVNPELFVMWDNAIYLAYYYAGYFDSMTPGANYANFLLRMQASAQSIALDAREQHEVHDPAVHVCDELGLQDFCALAKFIDEYNYLTITRGVVDPTNRPNVISSKT